LIDNETIEEIAERLKIPQRDLDPKMAKAIVIHGADLNELDQDQLDNILRYYLFLLFFALLIY
jgi:sodium/potassium-transporting ATPase subunit alpha